ncbi:Uu.00g121520.m01.CDS01 [Anthostomella pinea]|uniref:Uu.00g121520.m01.CDS01 n=1 Tax=Anthostomella pinea TaxID=933095 RepID=A0AAI8VH24_9PEZI|nr:Uu.00g121520.m01.CDS01 [Anthostomella pinea]
MLSSIPKTAILLALAAFVVAQPVIKADVDKRAPEDETVKDIYIYAGVGYSKDIEAADSVDVLGE